MNTAKRKVPSNNSTNQNGKKKETNKSNKGSSHTGRKKKKKSRLVWAIEVFNVKPTVKNIVDLERFFINQICPSEKKVLCKWVGSDGYHIPSSQKKLPEGITSVYLEFKNQSQQLAAFKLNDSPFQGSQLSIVPWIPKESSRSTDELAFNVENEREKHSKTPSNVDFDSQQRLLHQMDAKIEAKNILLAATNEALKALTEKSRKREKHLRDQDDQIEELKKENKIVVLDHLRKVDKQQEKIRSQTKLMHCLEAKLKSKQLDNAPSESQKQLSRIRDLEAELKNLQLANAAMARMIGNAEHSQRNELQVEILEEKLEKALQAQNKLLQENRQLRLDKQTVEQKLLKIKADMEESDKVREENESLLEEIEQMRMNHAMEIGFLEGSSSA